MKSMEENNIGVDGKKVIQRQSFKSSLIELLKFIFLAVLIVVPVRVFVAQPFVVSGSSMVPTFENGEYLIVDELSYNLGEPDRHDVIIFRYPSDPSKFFIKRVIGLPNETVDISGSEVSVTSGKDTIELVEPYVENKTDNNVHFELKDDEYFVMGDNRAASSDSRYWGAVPRDHIIGRAFLRLLPIQKIDILPGKYNEE